MQTIFPDQEMLVCHQGLFGCDKYFWFGGCDEQTPGKRRQEQEQQRDWGLEPDQVGGLSLGLERLREMDEQK